MYVLVALNIPYVVPWNASNYPYIMTFVSGMGVFVLSMNGVELALNTLV